MEKAETDSWRICQEQGRKTVYNQMNTHRPLSLSLYLSLFLHTIFPLLRYAASKTLLT